MAPVPTIATFTASSTTLAVTEATAGVAAGFFHATAAGVDSRLTCSRRAAYNHAAIWLHYRIGNMDAVFKALADPSRRKLLDSLNLRGGQTLSELCSVVDMARQSASKHLALLEASGLVTTVWRGREKLHYLNAAPIAEISDRWINRYQRRRVSALAGLKRALEDPSMGKPEFVYVTYIRTSPEQLWRALTAPEFTARYWGRTYHTDWKKGSPYAVTQFGIRVDDPEQIILEADPPRRLSYSWHTVTSEMAEAFAWTDEYLAQVAAEPRSRVTFEIEPEEEGSVRLTVVHDGFEEGSATLESISGGWPRVLANLKTLLETGEVEPLRPPTSRGRKQ
jgi:uncharacterized protein YndB with AHSA1/START domain/DNA-binding transcriptional ArsR family regulator